MDSSLTYSSIISFLILIIFESAEYVGSPEQGNGSGDKGKIEDKPLSNSNKTSNVEGDCG